MCLHVRRTLDAEVPIAQATVWKRSLKGRENLTVVEGPGFGHRFVDETRYDVKPVAQEILKWLGGRFQ